MKSYFKSWRLAEYEVVLPSRTLAQFTENLEVYLSYWSWLKFTNDHEDIVFSILKVGLDLTFLRNHPLVWSDRCFCDFSCSQLQSEGVSPHSTQPSVPTSATLPSPPPPSTGLRLCGIPAWNPGDANTARRTSYPQQHPPQLWGGPAVSTATTQTISATSAKKTHK